MVGGRGGQLMDDRAHVPLVVGVVASPGTGVDQTLGRHLHTRTLQARRRYSYTTSYTSWHLKHMQTETIKY